eukprot:81175-Rhodomonas_salina.1
MMTRMMPLMAVLPVHPSLPGYAEHANRCDQTFKRHLRDDFVSITCSISNKFYAKAFFKCRRPDLPVPG